MPLLRALGPADAEQYNAFLSEGARRHARTLRFSPADVLAAPFTVGLTSDGVTLVVVDDLGRWLGVGSLDREHGRAKRRHVAWLTRMLVNEPGRGVGRRVLRELLERARQMDGIAKVNLTVVADNAPAVRLYTSEGFTEFSRELDAFRVDGASVTELTMSHTLRR
jgi:GNAT superfamily N-acetyltransferase